ncbi:hypothetical protein B9Z55_026586 [Caenorhabditis nigoni]|uniref:Uncharacterized protein n=1 Tax=Caenorhabditis nigoni TaxID=1611254 RepID=A0A2G5T4C0_9PELO|nr:hypothetical protein B9Z55_026586 [Caenorhabditis nigoni]
MCLLAWTHPLKLTVSIKVVMYWLYGVEETKNKDCDCRLLGENMGFAAFWASMGVFWARLERRRLLSELRHLLGEK